MIFTLMRNRRLRRQVFVLWLVLGVGILPDKISALKCYSCEGSDCKTNFTATAKEVNCTTSYCEKIMDRDTFKMECSKEGKEAECIKKEFPNGCYAFSEEKKEKLANCTGAADAGATALKEGVKICSCDSDLCNNNGGGSGTAAGTGGGGSNQTTGGAEGRMENVKSVRCYLCDGFDQCVDQTKWKTGECQQGHCAQLRSNGIVVYKRCEGGSSSRIACYQEQGGCVTLADSYEKITKCEAAKEKRPIPPEVGQSLGPGGVNTVECRCNTNLCNLGERPGSSDKLYLLGILAASYGILTRL